MKRFNLCIDIDGTVTEPFFWLKKANEYFKTEVQPQNVTEYEIHEMLNIPEKDYVDFYNQYGVELHRDAKLRLGANELESDFFIEDSHFNAVQLSEAGFKVLLIDCYYNRMPTPPNVTRVGNWLEIVKTINEYNKSMMNEFKMA